MTAWLLIAAITVLCLLLKPTHELRLFILRQRSIRARKERRIDLYGVNPHRQGPPTKRSRFFRMLFLMKQNDSKFTEDTKFIYGNVFQMDNSYDSTDTTKVVEINVDSWENAVKLVRKPTWLRENAKEVSKFCSRVIREGTKMIHVIIKNITKYIYNLGGNHHA